tara:strand:- start:352 stop:1299 length:948 start_codon:yes stop_codon:yes gene_type:complete
MKYHETTFEDYIVSNEKSSLHPVLERNFKKYPKNMEELHNLIFYGPPGCGKYTQVLLFLKQYSQSGLKYEKRVTITSNKVPSYYKISDVHIEVDMGMLGCNSKAIWHDIYTHLNDMLNAKARKVGFVVCKNFHEIHNELLDIFYSYMQSSPNTNVVKFILITEALSFIPDNILECCESIHIPRPSRSAYSTCIGKRLHNDFQLDTLDNIKNIKDSILVVDMYRNICQEIIEFIEAEEIVKWTEFRDKIYDIFTYNIDVHKCIWMILSNILERNKIEEIAPIVAKTYTFLRLFNNNYRPIYHLESYFLFLKKELMK